MRRLQAFFKRKSYLLNDLCVTQCGNLCDSPLFEKYISVVYTSQFGNYGNSLSRNFGKNLVKVTDLLITKELN